MQQIRKDVISFNKLLKETAQNQKIASSYKICDNRLVTYKQFIRDRKYFCRRYILTTNKQICILFIVHYYIKSSPEKIRDVLLITQQFRQIEGFERSIQYITATLQNPNPNTYPDARCYAMLRLIFISSDITTQHSNASQRWQNNNYNYMQCKQNFSGTRKLTTIIVSDTNDENRRSFPKYQSQTQNYVNKGIQTIRATLERYLAPYKPTFKQHVS
eukprot:TRINITY_DN17135_c0_g1_i10.p3 TRINITY_DN17135_c0_g1~~TRINITY_DN17135_c0_g1_i10.p3  ORF type:complete len:216 (+),score=-10.11 TRINITY_DN17135_c0_g1_i10:1049-1696(+)